MSFPSPQETRTQRTASRVPRDARGHTVCVSIGLPVYNGERFLREAIESILRQSFRDFELIISDNASTDSTASICKEYARSDQRVRYYRMGHNVGAAKNFNRVFELSRGRYFKWVAADEGIEPTFLEQCVAILDHDPTVVVACTKYIHRNEFSNSVRELDYNHNFGSPYSHERFSKLLWKTDGPILPIWGLMRSRVLGETRLIRPFIGADHCLVAELILKGGFAQFPEHLKRLRTHREAYHTMSCSNHGMPGVAEARWFDPKSTGTVFLPHWRRLWEYSLLVLRANAGISSKIRMLAFLIYPFGARWWKLFVMDVAFAAGMGSAYVKARDGWKRIRHRISSRSRASVDGSP